MSIKLKKLNYWGAWKRGSIAMATISLCVGVSLLMSEFFALLFMALYSIVFGGNNDNFALYYLTPAIAIFLIPPTVNGIIEELPEYFLIVDGDELHDDEFDFEEGEDLP